MQNETDRLTMAMGARDHREPAQDGTQTSDAAVQAALARLAAQTNGPKPPRPGELKWKLTMMVLPAVMLVFVALYVTCLAANVQPEVALFQAGGASVVLAVLGRVAVSILGDDSRLISYDIGIVDLAQSGSVQEYLSGASAEHASVGAEQPSTTAQTAGAGGKE